MIDGETSDDEESSPKIERNPLGRAERLGGVRT